MKIYTKTGDKGQTSLIGGTRVLKSSLRIEAYGTVDELNSWVGVVRDHDKEQTHKAVLLEMQDRLFTIGSILASEPGKSKMKIPELREEDIVFLESEMDKMDESLPEMRSFVLPGGHPAVSFCHVARCVCRRAERICVDLAQGQEVQEILIRYLNRLSDYLFVLSRKLTQEYQSEESPWTPRM
jgi:cob(I)alamin adenosyltransferase